MINEYEKSIGIWTHELGDIKDEIVPEEGDNLAFVRVKKSAEKDNNEEILLKGIGDLYFGMVIRSDNFKQETASFDSKKLESLLCTFYSLSFFLFLFLIYFYRKIYRYRLMLLTLNITGE